LDKNYPWMVYIQKFWMSELSMDNKVEDRIHPSYMLSDELSLVYSEMLDE
jgi:hypothetical protein